MAHSGACHHVDIEKLFLLSYMKSIQRGTWKPLHLETASRRRIEINLFAEITLPSLSLCQNLSLGILVSHIPVLFNLVDYLRSHQRNPSFFGHNPGIVQAQGSLLVSWHWSVLQYVLLILVGTPRALQVWEQHRPCAKTTLSKKQGKWPRPGECILD